MGFMGALRYSGAKGADMTITTEKAATIAAKIRDHIANKTPVRCNPTFMDFEDHWSQVRHFPDLGLARHSVGPHGRSDVKADIYWAHDLLPDTYNTLTDLLAALETKK